MLPAGSARAAGLRVTFHADQPMFPEDPLSLMATAVNRRTRNGAVIGEKEKISLADALRAFTTDAAWQIGMEDRLGSILPGKYADFVVLDQNPLKVDPGRLREIRIAATYVNGTKIPIRPPEK